VTTASIGSWDDVERLLGREERGSLLRVPRGWLPHPRVYGMRPTVGLPLGQVSDFIKSCDSGRLRVERHPGHDLVWLEPPHRDRPARDGAAEAPLTDLARGIALGALVGAALGRSPAAVVAGAAAGALLSAASSARSS